MKVETQPKVDYTPAELDQASRLLLKAANLIEERGLAKHCREDGDGALCFYGAVSVAFCGNTESWFRPELGAAEISANRFERAVGYDDASIWNNAPERTQAEVVAKLRAVALGL